MVEDEFAATLDDDLALAHRLAALADGLALERFGSPGNVARKADGTQVTDVELHIERAVVAVLGEERPTDGVLTEESGAHGPRGRRRWLLDPIDGTESYVAGGCAWGTHVALERDGRVAAAVMTRPTEDRRWWASEGGGAFAGASDATQAPRRLTLSDPPPLDRARVGGLVSARSAAVAALDRRVVWVDDDLSVVVALLEGRADAVLDEGGDVWDRAPAVLLVLESGGRAAAADGGAVLDASRVVYGKERLVGEIAALLAGLPG